MRAAWLIFALSSCCLAQAPVAQQQPPRTLLQILHCAETDRLQLIGSGLKKNGNLRVAWAHKVRYEPYVDEFFIVFFKSETEGDILVYSRGYNKGKVEFYLDNNMGFVIGSHGLDLIDPLWGLWTRANIARNVKRALRGPTYSIPVKAITVPFSNLACYSFED